MTTPSLFDVQDGGQRDTGAPSCRMCARPARWSKIHRHWLSYCGGASCTNRTRICQQCGQEFERGVGGAGNKYCSNECKHLGYHPTAADKYIECTWCGTRNPKGNHRAGASWPYICSECIEPIKHVTHSLKAHNVPHERAKELVAYPYCEICGQNVVLPRLQTGGKKRPQLSVDHDHSCCPGDRSSCGACVRGLLCRQCNTAIGMFKDDAGVVKAAATYLESQCAA